MPFKKEYGLHCFGCGSQFYSREDVYRSKGLPYCGECISGFEDTGEDDYDEEEHRREVYIRKYGEY